MAKKKISVGIWDAPGFTVDLHKAVAEVIRANELATQNLNTSQLIARSCYTKPMNVSGTSFATSYDFTVTLDLNFMPSNPYYAFQLDAVNGPSGKTTTPVNIGCQVEEGTELIIDYEAYWSAVNFMEQIEILRLKDPTYMQTVYATNIRTYGFTPQQYYDYILNIIYLGGYRYYFFTLTAAGE